MRRSGQVTARSVRALGATARLRGAFRLAAMHNTTHTSPSGFPPPPGPALPPALPRWRAARRHGTQPRQARDAEFGGRDRRCRRAERDSEGAVHAAWAAASPGCLRAHSATLTTCWLPWCDRYRGWKTQCASARRPAAPHNCAGHRSAAETRARARGDCTGGGYWRSSPSAEPILRPS
eukprot:360528-Chlamydomonas_euryale.AAC.3